MASKTICIIEDNDSIRKLFVLLLRKRQLDVVEFASGEEALEWVVEHRPVLILTDIALPGISGTEVLQLVRSAEGDLAATKVVALTAFARQGDKEHYLELGFDGYLSKPIDPETFADHIADLLPS